jgi:class 3 adenylate cyclase/tetratricopeptide (TPR) repeat protein
MRCPRCRSENDVTAQFCEECGTKLELACPACGQPVGAGKKFCRSCGAALSGASDGGRGAAPPVALPKHLAERILTSKSALEGERKQVTVLFADLKGSMELLAERDPEEARRMLEPVLLRMIEAVHRYEGTVNQVMGDGIMALFGAPLAHEDHAVRACYAALRMHEAIGRYTEELRRTQGVEIQIRVGMNSGDVVVRSIGNDLRMDYTAVGQTTHLAARMEQLAPPGATRLTEQTLRLVEGFVQVRALGLVPVKGLAEPLPIFELLGAAAARTRLQAAGARGLTKFVGRDSEMDQLRHAADQARHGRGQIVAVLGEPGVGKSRLFYEFSRSHRAQDWLVLEASSVSYGKATPFLPLADLLRAYFRIEDRDDVRSIRAKVTGVLLTLDRALDDAVPPAMWLLDVLEAGDPFLALDPARRRQSAVDAVKRLLLRESTVQPLLLIFEDLHWIDAETQTFLDSLVESLPTAAVLMTVNYRPEYRHGWGSKTYYRQLRIDPLSPEGADALLRGLLGDDRAVEPLKQLLIERTEGNPLFLEESVRTLVESGLLAGERGAYRLTNATDAIRMPPTVQAILAARIDRLRPELKRLLQAASVVGKDVSVGLLEAIAELPADELRQSLGELQAAEFLYETQLFPDLEYTFKHALTHEVAYGSMLQERRRELHAALLSAMERAYADRLVEQVEVLAHHAVRGGIRDKALRYLAEAGQKACGRSAVREAVAFFEAALEILADVPETAETRSRRLDILIALGPAVIMLRSATAPQVEDLYRRALALVEGLGDVTRRFPVLWGLWFVLYTRGDYPAALAAGEELLEMAQAGDDTGRLVEAHHALWPTLIAMGQAAKAVPYAERGIALYRREHHAGQAFLYAGHDPGACCRYQLGAARWLLGYPDRAAAAVRDALRLAEDLKHSMTVTTTLWFVAWVQYQRGEHEMAAETTARQLALAQAHGFEHWTDSALIIPAAARKAPLAGDALDDLYRRLMAIRSAAWRRVFCLSILADLCMESGDLVRARKFIGSLRDEDRQAFCAPEIHRTEGEILLREGALAEAERRFHTAIDVARQRSEKSLELRATISLARLWRQRGRHAEARGRLGELYGWFTEGFDTADLRSARALLDELKP